MTDASVDRIGRIGGSDLAAVLGRDPYCTPYQAWRRITGREVVLQNKHMQRGKALESGVATLTAQRLSNGVTYEPFPVGRVTHPTMPWLIAHPDRILLGHTPHGWLGLICEIKCPAHIENEDQIPETYRIQLLHYQGMAEVQGELFCRQYDEFGIAQFSLENYGVISVLCGELFLHHLDYDRELCHERWRYATEWYRKHVESDTPPPLASDQDVAIAHPTSRAGQEVQLSDLEIIGELSRVAQLHKMIKELEGEYEAEKTKLKLLMKDAETLVDREGNVMASWKTHQERGFDFAAFRACHPQIAESFTIQRQKRPLLIKDEQILRKSPDVLAKIKALETTEETNGNDQA